MRISIVTPSFNQGSFIERCLASVRYQRGQFSIEHIILDNCSTDSTNAALTSYEAKPGTVHVRTFIEADSGQAAAINKGFGLASGDIVCWLNTDEWYEIDALSRVISFFKSHPHIDVLFANCNFVDSNGSLIKEKREYFFSRSMLLYYGCFLPSCATFVRRRVIDDGVVLNPDFKVAMDLDWYVRIAKAGYRFACLPETLANFTWHDTNISSTHVERRLLERRLVQDRYSGVKGPVWVRSLTYAIMRYFWLAVRVIRRGIA